MFSPEENCRVPATGTREPGANPGTVDAVVVQETSALPSSPRRKTVNITLFSEEARKHIERIMHTIQSK